MQKLLAARRFQMTTQGKTDIPAPQVPTPHPGYAPHAAFHAIKRHAAESLAQKEYVRTSNVLWRETFKNCLIAGRKGGTRDEKHPFNLGSDSEEFCHILSSWTKVRYFIFTN